MKQKALQYLPVLILPAVLTGCAGNRILETVRLEDYSYDRTNQMASTDGSATDATTHTDAAEVDFDQPSENSVYASEWSELDEQPSESIVPELYSASSTKYDYSDSTLSDSSAGGRLFGDAPNADLDSEISPDIASITKTNKLRTDKNDARLNLFGEVDGIGGLPGQFAAQEPIEQISFAAEGSDFDPSINMTGEFMLYASTQHSDTADVYRKSVDGTTVTRLTHDPADDMMPSYSPDNRHIAFSSNRAGNWDVYVMSADGGPPVKITNDPEHELHPSWSPDGKSLVYSRLSEASGRWEMWLTEFANPAKRRFLAYGLFPKWCPDPTQNKIVFQQARERGGRLFSVWTIDIINGEGRAPTEIASAGNAAAVNPSWSYDGSLITFATIVDPENQDPNSPEWADVWVIGTDGNGRTNLTNSEFSNLQPCFGPEGRIYFISDRSGIDNVWALWPDENIKTARGGVRGTMGRRTDMAGVATEEE